MAYLPSRRHILTAASASAGAIAAPALSRSKEFKPTWESLSDYRLPQWFADAKLGLWGHWGPQCVPEYGDWYGRQMYQEGNPYYDHHVKTYGHPSQFGFMEFIGRWKVHNWQPEALMKLYKAAGAKYFVAMANHHDNFDLFDSKFHRWNSLKVGPKVDIVGGWEKAARAEGLRFGVSNHAAHAWHWWQTAYGYDTVGPKAGVRYDAYGLRKVDGKGKWWQGLDPQELYCGPYSDMVPPNGLQSPESMGQFHDAHSGVWSENAPQHNPYFTRQWLMRQNDLIDKYRPDYIYFDNYGLPLEQAGLEATAHFYNQNSKWNGSLEAVVTGKKLNETQKRAIVDDVERGFSDRLRDQPWQTCTCIGSWHYDRPLYLRKGYKSAKNVIQRLIDVVSKNGNMLLSIPVRGDGSIDELEEAILAEMAAWMAINNEAIFATRPWRLYGEGPTRFTEGMQNEDKANSFMATDIRYTTKGDTLFALGQDWPEGRFINLTALAVGAASRTGKIERISLLGHGEALRFDEWYDGVTVELPEGRPTFTPVLKIEGNGLT